MKRLLYSWLVLLLLPTGVGAQTLRSSYFLSSMPMRHKLNPALVSDRGYISVPGLGNVMAGANSNLGITNFFYPTAGGGMTTFMNPSIPAAEFLDKIHPGNVLRADLDLTLLSTGFYNKQGFTTIDISVRSMSDMYVPGELFSFMKQGMSQAEGASYRIENLTLQSDNYVEIALGHALPIGDKLVIGAKIKALVGVASARSYIDRMDVSMSGDRWLVDANGVLDASLRGGSFKKKADGQINGVDWKNPGVSGWGLGLDMGMSYRFDDRWLLTAGLTDLGFISWNHNLRGQTLNEPFIFDGFQNIATGGSSSEFSLGKQWKVLKEDLLNLTRFYESEAPGSRTRMLKTTLTVGGEYAILNRKISFGLLSTTRFGLTRIWTEVTASANFRLARWFSAVLTASSSNYGNSWGWLLNFSPKGINFFFGTDHMVTRFTSQYIPLGKASAIFNFGLTVPIGVCRDAQFRRDPWRKGGVWRP